MRLRYKSKGDWEDFKSPLKSILVGRTDRTVGIIVDLDLTGDEYVSRDHARIGMDDGIFWIEDQNSENGTFVNGENVKGKGRVRIKTGEVLKIGETTLLVIPEAAGAEHPFKASGQPGSKKFDQPAEKLSPNTQLKVAVRCSRLSINYSLVHSGVPLLNSISIFNEAESQSGKFSLMVRFGEYAAFSWPMQLPQIPPRGSVRFKGKEIPPFRLDIGKGTEVRELRKISIDAISNEAYVPMDPPVEVKLLPPQAWSFTMHHQALATFVMPQGRAVREIVSRAKHNLRRLMGTESFADALESGDSECVEKVMQAVYDCLHENYAIAYEFEPRTYDEEWQMLRFHHEVLNELKGTCIDLAILLAACLEHVHLDPLIIIVRTAPLVQHALVACYRRTSSAKYVITRPGRRVLKWLQTGEVILLDSIGYARGRNADQSIEECRLKGEEYFEKACFQQGNFRYEYAIDITAARRRGLMPMPFEEGLQFDAASASAVFRAREIAKRWRNRALTARHLLVGLLDREGTLMRQIFSILNKEADAIIALIKKSLESSLEPLRDLPESDDWQLIMSVVEEKLTHRNKFLASEADLIEALLFAPTQIDQVLKRFDLNRLDCLETMHLLTGQGSVPSVWNSSEN